MELELPSKNFFFNNFFLNVFLFLTAIILSLFTILVISILCKQTKPKTLVTSLSLQKIKIDAVTTQEHCNILNAPVRCNSIQL